MPETIDPPSKTGSALPPSTGEINLDALGTSPRRQSLRDALEKRTAESRRAPQPTPEPETTTAPGTPNVEPEPKAIAPAPEPDKKPAPKPDQKPPEPTPEPTETPSEDGDKPKDIPPGFDDVAEQTAKPGKKPSPWKIAEVYKERAAQLEKDLAEAKKNSAPSEALKAAEEQFKKAQERITALEDEVRFSNYQASDEFRSKYQEPYEKAFKNAMTELKELSISDTNGQTRPVTPEDLLSLVNMPLGRAREVAKEHFGDFADDVMAHRKELKRLFEIQVEALNEAKTKGAERDKQRVAEFEKHAKELTSQVSSIWQEANDQLKSDDRFAWVFGESADDADGTAKLKQGYEFVDGAWRQDPMAPGLSQEERQKIVRSHAAIRNRAAAFGRLTAQIQARDKRIAALESELKEFKGSEPETKGSNTGTKPTEKLSARQRMHRDLEKFAK